MSDYTTDGKGQNTMGKKLQPKLRFRGFTDAWEPRRLGEICSFKKGQGYSKKDTCDSGTPLLLYGQMYTNYATAVTSADAYTTPHPHSVYSTGKEVIVPSSGETQEDIAVASAVLEPGIIYGGDINILTPPDYLNPVFLALTISGGPAHRRLAERAQGKTIVHLRNLDIAQVDIALPEESEQVRIAELFMGLDNLIDAEKRKLNLLKDKKTALLRQIFDQKARFKGYTDPWEQRKGAEVICVRRDTIANPPKDIVDVELENLIEGGGLQGDLSLRTASTSVFHEHDTLFGRLRPYLRKFWFANTSGVKSGEIWSLYSSTLKPEFLYALTQSAQFLNQALQTAGTKMPRAEWKTIVEAYFAVPQAEEQEKIGILFQKLEQLIDAESRKIDLLELKKKALLQQMFV